MHTIDPVNFFKCLADHTRLQCLLLLDCETELCVCEFTTAMNLTQPKISRHLAQLRAHNILIDRRQGQWVFYSINPELPAWCRKMIEQTRQANPTYLHDSLSDLQAMGERPERKSRCC